MNRKLSKKKMLEIMSKRFKKEENTEEESQQPVSDTQDGASFLRDMQAMDMMDGRPLALDGETLAIDVDRHGFRLVAVGTGRLDHLGSYGEAR